jgi:uncharacterized membrane protein
VKNLSVKNTKNGINQGIVIMARFQFPKRLYTKLPPIPNTNELIEQQTTRGDRASDWVASHIGSWSFIVGQTILLIIWAILNTTAYVQHWDPYPFILMNLVMSLQAAFTAPIIMMSQNRQADKDRIEAQLDFLVNTRTEEKVEYILAHLQAQNEALIALHERLEHMQ